jgi:hypothetical protein
VKLGRGKNQTGALNRYEVLDGMHPTRLQVVLLSWPGPAYSCDRCCLDNADPVWSFLCLALIIFSPALYPMKSGVSSR